MECAMASLWITQPFGTVCPCLYHLIIVSIEWRHTPSAVYTSFPGLTSSSQVSVFLAPSWQSLGLVGQNKEIEWHQLLVLVNFLSMSTLYTWHRRLHPGSDLSIVDDTAESSDTPLSTSPPIYNLAFSTRLSLNGKSHQTFLRNLMTQINNSIMTKYYSAISFSIYLECYLRYYCISYIDHNIFDFVSARSVEGALIYTVCCVLTF